MHVQEHKSAFHTRRRPAACEKVLDGQRLSNVLKFLEGAARDRARLVVPPLATKGIHGLIDQSSHGRETDRAEPITWMRQRQKLQRRQIKTRRRCRQTDSMNIISNSLFPSMKFKPEHQVWNITSEHQVQTSSLNLDNL